MGKLLILITAALISTSAHSYSADELARGLDGGGDHIDKLKASSFVLGWYRGFEVAHIQAKAINKLENPNANYVTFTCIPEGTSVNTLVRVFLKHVNDNPQESHEDAGAVLGSAVIKAYICPEYLTK